MDRILEPELMDDADQARAYASADFSDAEQLFVDLIARAVGPLAGRPARIADLGCGPGGLTIRLVRAFPEWTIDALDGAPAMIALARAAVAEAGLDGRVRPVLGRLPGVVGAAGGLPAGGYDAVVSSSLLHHLPQPAVLWDSMRRMLRPGGHAVVLDLRRPASDQQARALVRAVAADAHPILQADFYHSLRAALTPDEARAGLAEAGLPWAVSEASSRHLAVVGRR